MERPSKRTEIVLPPPSPACAYCEVRNCRRFWTLEPSWLEILVMSRASRISAGNHALVRGIMEWLRKGLGVAVEAILNARRDLIT